MISFVFPPHSICFPGWNFIRSNKRIALAGWEYFGKVFYGKLDRV